MADEMDREVEAIGQIIKLCRDPVNADLSPEAWDRIARYAEALFYNNEKKAEEARHAAAHAGFDPVAPEGDA